MTTLTLELRADAACATCGHRYDLHEQGSCAHRGDIKRIPGDPHSYHYKPCDCTGFVDSGRAA